MTLAATGDTWGVSGPSFLVAYLLIAVAIWVAGFRARRALADPRATSPAGDMTARPHDVAYLNGGAELAVYSALSSMHLRGTITSSRGAVQAAGRLDPGTDELERAIHFTARVAMQRKRLQFHRPVLVALAVIEKRLVAAGLLLSEEQRLRIRRVGSWMLVVAGLGLVRLLAGVAEAKPVGYLVVALVAVTAVAAVQLARAPRRTRLGDRTLATLRSEHHGLSPEVKPDWSVYGPEGAALGIGIFGMGALWASDPAFADELAAQRVAAGGSSGDGGSGSSSYGGDGGGGGGGGGGVAEAVAVAAVAERHALLPAGVGVGWRPEIAGWVAGLPGPAFCEVIAETLAPAAPPRGVVELRERGIPVVPHGVRLSLGGAEPVEGSRVRHLAACAAALQAPLVSEHVAFVRAAGHDAGHLLPVPRTREALDVLATNIRRTQAELEVPLALEPIAALFDWPDDEYSEPDFLTELLERTGALLLLDVANVYANAVNRGQDPEAVLDRLPIDRVAYVHVAGGGEHADDPGIYHDTHIHPVPRAVLQLVERLVERTAGPPPVMLERDGCYPPAAELRAELEAIAAAVGRPAPGDTAVAG